MNRAATAFSWGWWRDPWLGAQTILICRWVDEWSAGALRPWPAAILVLLSALPWALAYYGAAWYLARKAAANAGFAARWRPSALLLALYFVLLMMGDAFDRSWRQGFDVTAVSLGTGLLFYGTVCFFHSAAWWNLIRRINPHCPFLPENKPSGEVNLK